MTKLNQIESYDERIKYAAKVSSVQHRYSESFVAAVAAASFDRLKMVLDHKPLEKKLSAPIFLLRPKDPPPFMTCEENYGLDKYTEGQVTVHNLEGNHITIIENKDCANIINRILSEKDKNKDTSKTDLNVVTSMVENQRTVQI